jgi:hypothetical protein
MNPRPEPSPSPSPTWLSTRSTLPPPTSAPELKSSPSPVSTMHRTAGSIASSRNVDSSTGHATRGMAFFLPGLLNVTVATFPSLSTCTCPMRRTILTAVGLNPFRQHRSSAADVLLVAGALVVCAVLVAWALFG